MAQFLAQYQIFKAVATNASGVEPKHLWYWRLVGRNGEIVCVSEGYTRRSGAIRAAKRMPELANTDVISQVID